MTIALVKKSATFSRILFSIRNLIEPWTVERAGRGEEEFARDNHKKYFGSRIYHGFRP